jgi:FKBP-type peptidyl-prolyl cis-trans isomerase FkpA
MIFTKMKLRIEIIFLAIIICFFSCTKGKRMKTADGFKYILYTESNGPKAQIGNYITMVMVYKNSKDSILFDSRISNKTPIRFRLEKIPFRGSFEDGLTYMSKNDSATFFVPADSLYNYLYKSRGTEIIPQQQTEFIPGTYVTFDIKVLNIQNGTEAEQEMMMDLSKKEKVEKKEFADYLSRKNISVAPDPAGFYLVIHEKGSGEPVDSGKIVTIEYEGRFLNDSIYDGTKQAGHPYKFISGANHVIPGWEMAMKKLHAGDKFSILLPSSLAFGEEGIRNPKNGNYIVPPYTPLVFDIHILSVEDAPSVSGR